MTEIWAKGHAVILFCGGLLWMLAGNDVLFGLALAAWGALLFALLVRLGRQPDSEPDDPAAPRS